MAAAKFGGFPKDLFQFLGELGVNNEKEWFDRNKARYEASVREPSLEFVRAMAPRLRKLSSHFVADDRKVGGSLMRIHRDVRFSKDKTPYKTNVGIQFRHEAGKDVHAPGVYLHLEPGAAFLGVGLWHPEPDALAAIRKRIAENPAAWKKARGAASFGAAYRLEGESLKRPPKGIDPDHPQIEDLKRKDHIAVTDLKVAALTKLAAADEVAKAMVIAKPYVRFLCEALKLPF